jgi:autoinducer-2 kinase
LPGKAFLVIDVGTGGAKCVFFDSEGSRIFSEKADVTFEFVDGGSQFDSKVVWDDLRILIRAGLKECDRKNLHVAAVSSTSMREGNVFYDVSGKELLAVPNIDSRAIQESRAIPEALAEEIYRKSGHWPSGIFLVNRLGWLKTHKPSLYHRVASVSMINDWVLFKLSGRLSSEPTNGCETAAFDLAKRTWSEEIMKELKLDFSVLPEMNECGTVLGGVTSVASASTGLPSSAIVVVGAADTEAAVLGCGVLEPGDPVAVAGTTTPVQSVTTEVVQDRKMRTWTCCHPVPNRWVVESNAVATGLVFNWWSKLVGIEYRDLDNEVPQATREYMSVRARIGTNLMNARGMHPLQGLLSGIGPWTSRASITRAILEDSAFAVRGNLEQIEEVLKTKFTELSFCGGCAKSDLWSQLTADIANRKLIRFKLGDATARGAAMLSSVASGEHRSLRAAARDLMGDRSVLSPQKKRASENEQKYKNWLGQV